MLQKEDLIHQSDQPVLNPPKWLKKLTMILASVLLLTMFGLGGYWLGARRQESLQTALQASPMPIWLPSATPAQRHSIIPAVTTSQTDQTAHWKTYKHEGYGFLIQYPPNLRVVDQRTDFVGFYGESTYGSQIAIAIEPAYYRFTPEKHVGNQQK